MAIKELAGHRQISTTVRYMHLSLSAKESAIGLLNGEARGEAGSQKQGKPVVTAS